MPLPFVSILGPTASGKSRLAIAVAEALNGEIVSCDSMTVYRGLDVGTAKPSADERSRVPHHLIDVVGIEEAFDVHRFVELANVTIDNIQQRHRVPILCGGTGLYARALLYGFDLAPHDQAVAANVQETFATQGAEPLLAELRRISSAYAERVADNPRRLCRAVEIVRLTGAAPTSDKADAPIIAGRHWILLPTPEWTREQVVQRTEAMLDNGWIKETEHLVARGLLNTPTACQALGYRQIAAFLNGEIANRDELLRQLITATCQYAKRQRTWFRHQHPGCQQLLISGPIDLAELVDRITSDSDSEAESQ